MAVMVMLVLTELVTLIMLEDLIIQVTVLILLVELDLEELVKILLEVAVTEGVMVVAVLLL
jgi:hypothetical protein